MKERPIIFAGDSVVGIVSGRKTQTRRLVKPPRGYEMPVDPNADDLREIADGYAMPGDLLWVKETLVKGRSKDTGDGVLRPTVKYAATLSPVPYREGAREGWCGRAMWQWRGSSLSPLFMPRWASRLTLEILAVRVERLQEITEEDARAEGVGACGPGGDCTCDTQRYARLWDALNGKRAPWRDNPFVYVVTFTRIDARSEATC